MQNAGTSCSIHTAARPKAFSSDVEPSLVGATAWHVQRQFGATMVSHWQCSSRRWQCDFFYAKAC